MSREATITLVPYEPVNGELSDRLDKTLDRMSEHVAQAAIVCSDLVAFPEICAYLGTAKCWVFEPLDGPTISAMRKAARRHSIYVVIPQATMDGSKRRNSSVLIDRQGEIVGVYHKNVPTHGELDMGIIPGTETPVFETDFGRVGLTICFDLNYWEVGAGLCAEKAELVIWSSMWQGVRMMSRWSIEFGFYMAGVYGGAASFIDLAGRPISSLVRNHSWSGRAPLATARLDLDRRLLHHDKNAGRLIELFAKYGPTAAYTEWLNEECLLLLRSQLPGRSTDDLIEEFHFEPMRDYLARVRRDRGRALTGTYPLKQ
ncbi:MAG: carbon-nitrogen hydrolase family protein [Planctomycetaceae bacterium]|nr:carbon-nitrogen hydrolase family protein [Planctomycetaceae bacterium]